MRGCMSEAGHPMRSMSERLEEAIRTASHPRSSVSNHPRSRVSRGQACRADGAFPRRLAHPRLHVLEVEHIRGVVSEELLGYCVRVDIAFPRSKSGILGAGNKAPKGQQLRNYLGPGDQIDISNQLFKQAQRMEFEEIKRKVRSWVYYKSENYRLDGSFWMTSKTFC